MSQHIFPSLSLYVNLSSIFFLSLGESFFLLYFCLYIFLCTPFISPSFSLHVSFSSSSHSFSHLTVFILCISFFILLFSLPFSSLQTFQTFLVFIFVYFSLLPPSLSIFIPYQSFNCISLCSRKLICLICEKY